MTVIIQNEVYMPPLGDAVNFSLVTASVGRKMYIQKDGEIIAGLRVTTPSITADSVDITDINSGGYRELLSDTAMWSMDIGIEGITKNAVLRDAIKAVSDISLPNTQLVYSDLTIVSGDYKLTNFTESAPHNDAISFTATLQLSGIPQIG